MFLQDNAHKYMSKICSNFFSEEAPEVIQWLANSPNMNSFKTTWASLKQRLQKQTVLKEKVLKNVKGLKILLETCVIIIQTIF